MDDTYGPFFYISCDNMKKIFILLFLLLLPISVLAKTTVEVNLDNLSPELAKTIIEAKQKADQQQDLKDKEQNSQNKIPKFSFDEVYYPELEKTAKKYNMTVKELTETHTGRFIIWGITINTYGDGLISKISIILFCIVANWLTWLAFRAFILPKRVKKECGTYVMVKPYNFWSKEAKGMCVVMFIIIFTAINAYTFHFLG